MKSTRYSCRVLMKSDFFFRQIFENTAISNFTKIRPVGAELFHADGLQFCESSQIFHVVSPAHIYNFDCLLNKGEYFSVQFYLTGF